MHMHMLTTDPVYKTKYDKDRAEKEKTFKEQIDRDNREKDRKAGVKLPPPLPSLEQPQQPPSSAAIMDKSEQKQPSQSRQESLPTQQKQKPSHTQHPFSPMISVKPEFRQDTKKEHHQNHREVKPDPHPALPPPPQAAPPAKKAEDEGIKATMETRGPPPATPTSFASLMHPALMGRSPFTGYDPAMLAGLPPHVLASVYASNPYAAAMAVPHLAGQMRPPGLPGMPNTSQSPEDLGRSAALAMAAMSSLTGGVGGSNSSATKALDLLAQQANQYYAAVAASAGQGVSTTTTSSASPSSNSQIHKIHELQERALKSPVTNRSTSSPSINLSQSSFSRVTTPTSMLTSTVPTTSTTTKSCTSDLSTFSKRTPSPSSRATPTGARSPPPLRHVHTHTHTHFGLGYPLLSPSHTSGIPGVGPAGPPAAHTPFPPAGYPSHLLPGKPPLPGALPNFPPPK